MSQNTIEVIVQRLSSADSGSYLPDTKPYCAQAGKRLGL
jgi:hypothetical protein